MARAARLIEFRAICDDRGSLTVAEIGDALPFVVQRVFLLGDGVGEVRRGGHAHRVQEQVLLCTHGRVRIDIYTPAHSWFCLSSPAWAIYIPPLVWVDVTLYDGAQLLALASDKYDEADYIRSRDEFDLI